MKLSVLFMFICFATQAAMFKVAAPTSKVGFEIAKFKIGSVVPGTFDKFEGSADLDEGKGDLSKVTVTIQTASINTQDEKRDGHLKSADFFDAEKNPTITFTQTKNTKIGPAFDLVGNLTMKGITKPVTLKVTRSPNKDLSYTFNAVGEINRQDFNVTWNKDLPKGEAKSVLGVLKDKVLDDTVKLNFLVKFEPTKN